MEKDAAGSPQGHTNPGISRYLASRLPYACTVRRGEGPKPIGPSYPYRAETPGITQGRRGQADRRPQVGRTPESEDRRLPRAGSGWHPGIGGPTGGPALQ